MHQNTSSCNLIIYGAQAIALGAYRAIHNLYPKRNISCFLVTKRGMNANCLDGVPVVELSDFVKDMSQAEKDKVEILIATPENVMSDIEEALEEEELHNHVRLTSGRWAKLMSYHYANTGEFIPLTTAPVGYHKADICMYMAKFYKDAPLTTLYNMPNWIVPVQVGAALTDCRVAELLDCTGENISEKNVNYSELTALYWMWKNCLERESLKEVCGSCHADYYGLVHYRRILELTADDVLRLADNDIDVVLPYPMPYQPNIHAHHERYLQQVDWQALLTALQELQPEYANKLPEVFEQQYLYNYNILLAKKNILREYCEWLFPILERTEELSIPRGGERADRYIGYMGENLATLYFMANRDNLNIVHAGCRFLT